MSFIEFRSVTKTYERRPALSNFTLHVEQGERLVILGPSGCGKTTVLRLLAGLAVPDEGAITVADTVVATNGRVLLEPEKRNIGMVFQDLALWPHLTVEGNLQFGLNARRVPKALAEERIDSLLRLTDLADRRQALPAELSGGEQQRVALARALVLEPLILLMDEPLSSLNLELSVGLRAEIRRLHERLDFTLLYVTHSREEAFEIGQRVVMMENGQVDRIGLPAEIRKYLNDRLESAGGALGGDKQ